MIEKTPLELQIEHYRKEIHSDSYPMSIGEAVSMYKNGDLEIHPEFQRFFRWNSTQKSRFIESILLGIPVPSFFVSQREDGVWDLIDGLQRFSTILQFIGELNDENGEKINPLPLVKSVYLTELEGVYWANDKQFTPALKRDFKREKIDFKIIKKESSYDTKYELFNRLNTGGSSLSDQEVRNCLLILTNKKFYDWIIELSEYDYFKLTTILSEDQLSKRYDLELIIRFFACTQLIGTQSTPSDIGDLNKFLDNAALSMAKDSNFSYDDQKQKFEDTFRVIYNAVEENAFKKYSAHETKFKGAFSIALFEAVTIGIYSNLQYYINECSPENLERKIKELSTNRLFTSKTGSGIRGNSRIATTIPIAVDFFCK